MHQMEAFADKVTSMKTMKNWYYLELGQLSEGQKQETNKQTKHGIKVSETLLLLTVLFFKIFKVFCVKRPVRIVLPLKSFTLNWTTPLQDSSADSKKLKLREKSLRSLSVFSLLKSLLEVYFFTIICYS